MSTALVKVLQGVVIVLVGLAGLVLLLPLILLVLLFEWAHGRWLRWSFQRKWGARGKFMIFVYSESPNWEQYIEEHILPRVRPSAVILNWSKRSEWKKSPPVEVKVFRHFGGGREFNPMAILLPRHGKIRTVRFWQAFRDFKHGKDHMLRAAEAELFHRMDEMMSQAGV